VRRLVLLAAALTTMLVGCDQSFVKGWQIDRTRVLGARVEAEAEPSRASIAPGEPLRIRWLVGAPGGPVPLAWSWVACAPVLGHFPEARCERPVVASGAGASAAGEPIELALRAPAIEEPELLVLVAFCSGSAAPSLEPTAFTASCPFGDPLLASVRVRLAAAGPNANPEIGPGAILLDGAPMPPPAVACDAAPVVRPGSAHPLVFRFTPEQREPTETLIVSHVVAAGELDRQYTALEPDEPAPKDGAVEWRAPLDPPPPPEGRLEEIFFVLRDGRGGAAFARRTVCVRP
jgi:hypothetical protein